MCIMIIICNMIMSDIIYILCSIMMIKFRCQCLIMFIIRFCIIIIFIRIFIINKPLS